MSVGMLVLVRVRMFVLVTVRVFVLCAAVQVLMFVLVLVRMLVFMFVRVIVILLLAHGLPLSAPWALQMTIWTETPRARLRRRAVSPAS